MVELMVTIAVLAVVLAIGFPSFTGLFNSNRLSSAANEMVASLQIARMEAIRLNGRTIVCRSDNGTSCSGGTAAWAQWITLADTDRDNAVDDVVRVSMVKTPVLVQANAAISNSQVEFRPDGMARTSAGALLAANIGVCVPTTKPVDNVRTVQLRSGSRISTTSGTGGGVCNAPANP